MPAPLPVTMGGTGTGVAADPGMVFYSAAEGLHQTDPNFRYDSQKQQINLTGGVNSQLNSRLAANFAVTSSTTLANISASGSDLATPVANGGVYAFEAILYTTSNVAGGIKAAIAGTCGATSIIYEAEVIETGVLKVPGTSRTTTKGTAVGDITAVTVAKIVIRGLIVVSTAGTLTVQFAQNASNGSASTVLAGSTFTLSPRS